MPKIQHIQKALALMNVQLANVVDDIIGMTGLKIIRAIIEGEGFPQKRASFRDERCRKSEEVIAKSLKGNYRDEHHLFSLQQSV